VILWSTSWLLASTVLGGSPDPSQFFLPKCRFLAENSIFRFKTIFGDRLSARLLETQATQARICCAALNRMTHLGMPDSYKVSCAGYVA
jgi:hypothetical protein